MRPWPRQCPEIGGHPEFNWSMDEWTRGDFAGCMGFGVWTGYGFGPAIRAPSGDACGGFDIQPAGQAPVRVEDREPCRVSVPGIAQRPPVAQTDNMIGGHPVANLSGSNNEMG